MKKYTYLALFLCLALGCKKEKSAAVSLQEDVSFLASDALGGRETGSDGELKAAGYIQERMAALNSAINWEWGTCPLVVQSVTNNLMECHQQSLNTEKKYSTT